MRTSQTARTTKSAENGHLHDRKRKRERSTMTHDAVNNVVVIFKFQMQATVNDPSKIPERDMHLCSTNQ